MEPGFPPLKSKNLLESNPLKSRFLIDRSSPRAIQALVQRRVWWAPTEPTQTRKVSDILVESFLMKKTLVRLEAPHGLVDFCQSTSC